MSMNVGFGQTLLAQAKAAAEAKAGQAQPAPQASQTVQAAPSASPAAAQLNDKAQPQKDEAKFTTKIGNFAKSPVGIVSGLATIGLVASLFFKGKNKEAKKATRTIKSNFAQAINDATEKLRTQLIEFKNNNKDVLKSARKALKENNGDLSKLTEAQQTAINGANTIKEQIKNEIVDIKSAFSGLK